LRKTLKFNFSNKRQLKYINQHHPLLKNTKTGNQPKKETNNKTKAVVHGQTCGMRLNNNMIALKT